MSREEQNEQKRLGRGGENMGSRMSRDWSIREQEEQHVDQEEQVRWSRGKRRSRSSQWEEHGVVKGCEEEQW